MKVNLTITDGKNTKTMELTGDAIALIADGARDAANDLESKIGETSKMPEAKQPFSIEGLENLQSELYAFSRTVERLILGSK